MLVDRPEAGEGRAPAPTRVTQRVVRNLDRDLPGRRLAHGINMGLTPVLFAAIGYGIDRLVGTLPVFTVALAVISVAGLLVSSYYRFKAATDPVAGETPE